MKDVDAMPALIERFLAEHPPAGPCRVTGYRLMTGGYSRVMARVEIEWDGGGREVLVMRGDPPPDETLLVTDRDVEWRVLDALREVEHLPMPAARFFASDEGHFGTKALFLDYVDAPSLQSLYDDGRPAEGDVEAVAELAARVASVEPASMPALDAPPSWDAHLDALIEEWNGMDHAYPASLPIIRYIGSWLAANKPPPVPLRLVHGDFQAANVLVPESGLQLVDWEFARVGDPREDLGWYNSYSTAAPPNLLALDADRFLGRYREVTGFDEVAVNPLTVGYFTILATVKVLSGIYTSLAALEAGEAHGANIAFNQLSATFGHFNFMNAVTGIEAAMAALGGAS